MNKEGERRKLIEKRFGNGKYLHREREGGREKCNSKIGQETENMNKE